MRPIIIRKKRCILLFSLFVCLSISLWIVMMVPANDKRINPPPLERLKVILPPRLNVFDKPLRVKTISNSNQDDRNASKEIRYQFSKVERQQKKKDSLHMLQPKYTDNVNSKNDIQGIYHFNTHNDTARRNQSTELAKNKTLAHLGILGIVGKEEKGVVPKVIFSLLKWNLSVSFEDIGNIMKDTSFFNKLRPLDVNGPFLQSSRNRTANFSLSMPFKMGYCDCWELHCFCCAQMVNKQLHLNTKSCANFTFISKSHELDLTFSIDGVFVHRQLLSADSPPLLCMGSIPTVADICVHFSNMTYRVDRMSMHKSQLLGCTDFSFNIYNKTVNAFPVDCFQIPGDPNHHPKHEQMILPNFVP